MIEAVRTMSFPVQAGISTTAAFDALGFMCFEIRSWGLEDHEMSRDQKRPQA